MERRHTESEKTRREDKHAKEIIGRGDYMGRGLHKEGRGDIYKEGTHKEETTQRGEGDSHGEGKGSYGD